MIAISTWIIKSKCTPANLSLKRYGNDFVHVGGINLHYSFWKRYSPDYEILPFQSLFNQLKLLKIILETNKYVMNLIICFSLECLNTGYINKQKG